MARGLIVDNRKELDDVLPEQVALNKQNTLSILRAHEISGYDPEQLKGVEIINPDRNEKEDSKLDFDPMEDYLL